MKNFRPRIAFPVMVVALALFGSIVGLSIIHSENKKDPNVETTISIIKNGSDDELWNHKINLWREWKENGNKPLSVWSASTCKRMFDVIVQEMVRTHSEKRTQYLFFYLTDFTYRQKDHFILENLCTDQQFDAMQHRFEQYNANVDFWEPKLSIVKVNSETGKSAIMLRWTRATP